VSWRRRRHVANDQHRRIAGLALAQEGEDGVGPIVADDPAEALGAGVTAVQRRLGAIKPIEVAYQPLDAGVVGIVEQEPVDLAVMVPLALLGDLAAHEQQLLARMRPHEAQIGAQVGEFLPAIARHAAEQRAFAMHYLVMRDRQDEAFGKGIDQPERHVVVVIGAMDRIVRHVAQRVVHPAHVPFVGEAEAQLGHRLGDAGPRRRFLGDHDGAGAAFGHDGVEVPDEVDRLEMLAAAMDVGHPFTGVAAVVAIEHRSHGIDP
jgi:hypothetical protein